MKNFAKKILKPIIKFMYQIGFDYTKILHLKNYFRYKKNRKEWISKGGTINRNYMILSDYEDEAGIAKGHYFHQDLLVANLIYEHKPRRHIDIGSRVDGFVAHVASFRELEVVDIRPLKKSEHHNIKFLQANLMENQNFGNADSVSCLHAIEHFGLGRYSDPIDIDGHIKAITNLVNLVSKGGRLYVSFPIGQNEEVHFNAHRIFKVDTILSFKSIKDNMQLIRFDYIDDKGDLHTNSLIENVDKKVNYGCGIYTFEKIKNP